MLAGSQRFLTFQVESMHRLLRALVVPHRLAVHHIEAPAGKTAALGSDHPFRATFRHMNLSRDAVGSVAQRRRGAFGMRVVPWK